MRKIIFLSVLFISLQFQASAQEANANSELLKSKFLTSKPAGWDQLYAQYKKELKDSVVDKWRNEVIDLYDKNEFEAAHKLIDVCLRISSLIPDVDLNGKCLLVKSEIYYFEREYDHSIDLAQRAGKAFIQSNNKFELARSKNRLGMSYVGSKQPQSAQNSAKSFEEAIALKKQLLATDGPENKNYNISLLSSFESYGTSFYNKSEYAKAIPIYQQGLEFAQKIKHPGWEAAMLYNLGLCHNESKQFVEAIPFFEKAIMVYTAKGDSAGVMDTYSELIKAQDHGTDKKDAIESVRKALTFGLSMQDKSQVLRLMRLSSLKYKWIENYEQFIPFSETRALLYETRMPVDSLIVIRKELASTYKTVENYDKAIEQNKMVYEIYKKAGNNSECGEMARAIGKLYEEQKKDFKSAGQYYQLCEEHYKKTNEVSALATAYWNQAYNWGENEKNYVEAINSYKNAIASYTQIKDTTNWKTVLCNMGYTYRDLNDSINAYKAHQQAIDLTLKNSDPKNLSYAYDKAYDSYSHFGNFGKAIEFLKKKYELYKRIGDNAMSGSTAVEIATAYDKRKDSKTTGQYITLSIEHYKKAKDPSALAKVYWAQAYNQAGENKNAEAIASYKLALALYTQLKDTVNGKTVLCNIGITYRDMGDSINSYKAHQQAITLTLKNSDPDNLIYAYDKAIETYGHFKNHKKKLEYLKKKYENYKAREETALCASQTKDLGKEYEEGVMDFKTASQYYLLSIDYYKNTTDKEGLADAYWNYAYNANSNQKKYKEAIEYYNESIALYTQLKDTTQWKTLLVNVALVYRDAEDSVNCYKFHQKAIDLTLKGSNRALLANSYDRAGKSRGHFKNFRKKIELMSKAKTIYEQLGDHVKAADANETIGKVYQEDFKDYKTAEPYFLQDIEQSNLTKDLNAQALAYWNFAYNLNRMEEYREAIKNYEKAFQLYILNKDTSNASIMRSNVGQTLWSLKDFDKAIEAHKEAIKLATAGKNQEMIYKSWNALADLYKATGNPVNSTEAFKNAIIALEVLKDSAQLATSYSSIASSYSKSKDYVKSFEYYAKAAAINKIRKDTASWASVLYDWAGVYNDKKDYKLATEKYKASLALSRKIKDKSNEVYCLVLLASIEQSSNNDYKKAEPLYNEAVTMAKELNNESLLAFCYNQMKYLYRSTGRAALADENSEKALTSYKKLKDWTQVASSLQSIAYDAYYVYGDITKAMNYYDQAKVIADTLSNKLVLAGIIEGKGTIYEEQGEFAKALEMIDKSYDLYKAVDNEWGIAGTYIDRGNVYKVMSEYEIAMRYQSKADSMYIKMGTEYARLAPLANLGENYVAQGNYPKGLEYTLKSYELMKKAGDMDANVCIVKLNVGDIYYEMNNYAESEKWLMDALETSRKVGAKRVMMDIFGELGRLKIDLKKYDEAEGYLIEGVRIAKETGITLGYLNNMVLMGKLKIEQKQFEKAKEPLEETYKLSKSIGKDNTLWEALYLLGVLYKNTGDLPKSKEYLIGSVKVIEKIRNKVVGGAEAQKLFSSDKNILKVYDALVETLLALGETEEAMTYIQKNNEDNLKAKFKGLDVKFENKNKSKAIEDERTMKAKLDGIEQQIINEKLLAADKQNKDKLKNLEGVKTIAESEYLKFVNQQINVQPELSKFFNNSVQPTQFRKIKSKIPKDMALVSYLAGENQLYIFAATSDTVVAKIVTVSRAQLTKDINGMLNIILNSMGSFSSLDLKNEVADRQETVNEMKQTDAMIKPFEDAYHYLIAPVGKEISGKTRLGIIPTGALNYIPFQMLGKTLANGKFSLMMNQYAIFYANSTDMLFRDEKDINKNYNILAFGNPDASLPSTEKEVNAIKTMYPTASIFVRGEATEDKAKFANESYNVMHFATHGNLDYEDFSQSFITMAGNPSKSEDGKLTLEELWGMEVMTHLNIVVLSACQTAVTKGSNESSAVSPASGFLQNGVKSVVASLWKVDDEATSLMMGDFYKNIKTMDSVDALRSAQITLSKNPKFVHPYYWAGFVLLGDWR